MKNKTRLLILLVTCLIFLVPSLSGEKKTFWSRFSLKFTGGWGSRIPIGDVNDALKSFNDNEIFQKHRKYNSGLVVGELKTLDDRISHWEAELKFDLAPRISLGIDTSAPIHKHNHSSVTYTLIGQPGPQVMTWTFTPEIRVSYPVRLSAYYTLPIIRRLSAYIGGGVGFYSARVSEFLRFDEIPPAGGSYWYIRDQVAKQKFGLGLHGNVSLQYSITNRFALLAEFQKRQIRIGSFEGNLNSRDIYGVSHEKRGTLYYYTIWDLFVGVRHADLGIWPDIPEDPFIEIRDIKKATVDLSGYSIRLGISVRLF